MVGTVTLSVEVELGWGVHDLGDYRHLSENGGAERAFLSRLLDRCDEVGVPLTFDVVGHLLLEHCDGAHEDAPHRDDWFDRDPGTDLVADPLFYAPDAIRAIGRRPAGHEVCTHTFSHVLCDRVAEETLAWELEQVRRLHRREFDEQPVSFVPPRHYPPPPEVLRDGGIRIVRKGRSETSPSRLHKAKELVFGPHPCYEPRLVDGIVETYGTTYPSLTAATLPSGQRRTHRAFAGLPVRVRQRLHERYLRQAVSTAVERDGHCHLWCHLYDLANEYQWDPLHTFLGELATRRDRGEVEILPMRRLDERIRNEETEGARSRTHV